MGKKTKIDWCDSTWNPVTGCLHGCAYCYARRIAERFGGYPSDEKLHEFNVRQMVRHRNDDGEWNRWYKCAYPFSFAPTLHRYKLEEPRHWKKQRTIFVCSMADLFGEWVPDMFLPVAREGCHGLYIELKRRDGGRVSPEQTAWMDALARQGYKTALCHGWDAAREEIQRYLGGKWA